VFRALPAIARDASKKSFQKLRLHGLRNSSIDCGFEKLRRPNATKVTGIDIEHAFRRLAKYSCGKEDAVYNIASMVNAYFD
jgi:hypothetical protein